MSIFKREATVATELDKVREVEGQIRELLRRDISGLRPSPETKSDLVADNIGSLLQLVAGAPAQEIDRLIVELQNLRTTLSTERERVQREIIRYATLSQAAMQSTKILAESMTRWGSGRS
jgi:hypothetical protein